MWNIWKKNIANSKDKGQQSLWNNINDDVCVFQQDDVDPQTAALWLQADTDSSCTAPIEKIWSSIKRLNMSQFKLKDDTQWKWCCPDSFETFP